MEIGVISTYIHYYILNCIDVFFLNFSSETWNLLPEETKDELLERRNDGEFWMHFEDFVKTYTFLEFCHPNPDFYKKAEEQIAHWKCFMIDGAWTAGISNGGLPNNLSKLPKYTNSFRNCLSTRDIQKVSAAGGGLFRFLVCLF